jgi:hypothetical protein
MASSAIFTLLQGSLLTPEKKRHEAPRLAHLNEKCLAGVPSFGLQPPKGWGV